MQSARLHLTVSPGAKRSGLEVLEDGSFRVRVAAPAAHGKANRELLRFLAELLDVPGSRLVISQGFASRHKMVEVKGLELEETVQRLCLAATPE